jgi:hypothetical protein
VVAKRLTRYLFLVCFVLASGCSAMESKASPEAIALLEIAITAIDTGDILCEATEFSTEDQQVLAVLRERDFAVVAYKSEQDDEGIEHQFILRQRSSQMLLSADVVVARGECLTYTFARIAQGE